MSEFEIKQQPNYFNYKISIGHAIVFFIITFILGQFLNTLVSAPAFKFPVLSHILYPLGFFVGFGTSAYVIMRLIGLDFKELKNFYHLKVSIPHVLLSVLLYIVSLPIAEFLATLVPTTGNEYLELLYRAYQEAFEQIFQYKVAAFIMVCLLAPLLEELIFRGLILRGLLNKGVNPWGAIILTGFLFGLAHFNPWQFFGAGFIGIILGFVYWRTQSLSLCVLLHFLNNFIAFVITLITEDLEETYFAKSYYLLAGAVFVTLIVGYFLYNKSESTALHEVE